MGTGNRADRLPFFDLDALREAFKKSVREHNVTDADWAEHAKLFIQQLADDEPDEKMDDLGGSDP